MKRSKLLAIMTLAIIMTLSLLVVACGGGSGNKNTGGAVTFDKTSYECFVGEEITIKGSAPKNATVTWRVQSTTKNISIVGDGDTVTVTGLAIGFGKIEANIEGGDRVTLTINVQRKTTASGTAIKTAAEFLGMDENGTYTLANDIDFSKVKFLSEEDLIASFNGTLDGKGHTLNNLYIELPEVSIGGLFRAVGENGIIKNLNIVNAHGSFAGYSGIIAGDVDGTLENIFLSGEFSNNHSWSDGITDWHSFAGAAVGSLYAGGTLKNIITDVKSFGDCYNAGPLVGRRYADSILDLCYTASPWNEFSGEGWDLITPNEGALVANNPSIGSLGENAVGGTLLEGETVGKLSTDRAQSYKTLNEIKSSGNFTAANFPLWDLTTVRVKVQ